MQRGEPLDVTGEPLRVVAAVSEGVVDEAETLVRQCGSLLGRQPLPETEGAGGEQLAPGLVDLLELPAENHSCKVRGNRNALIRV